MTPTWSNRPAWDMTAILNARPVLVAQVHVRASVPSQRQAYPSTHAGARVPHRTSSPPGNAHPPSPRLVVDRPPQPGPCLGPALPRNQYADDGYTAVTAIADGRETQRELTKRVLVVDAASAPIIRLQPVRGVLVLEGCAP